MNSEQSTAYFVGIDVCKAELELAIRPSGESMTEPNSPAGIRTLLTRPTRLGPQLVVVEATGGLKRQELSALSAAAIPVAVVNPRQIRDFAKATGQLAKTDRIDCGILAHFAEAIRAEPRHQPDEAGRLREALQTRRRQGRDAGDREQPPSERAEALKDEIDEQIAHLRGLIKKVEQRLRALIVADPELAAVEKVLRSATRGRFVSY